MCFRDKVKLCIGHLRTELNFYNVQKDEDRQRKDDM